MINMKESFAKTIGMRTLSKSGHQTNYDSFIKKTVRYLYSELCHSVRTIRLARGCRLRARGARGCRLGARSCRLGARGARGFTMYVSVSDKSGSQHCIHQVIK